MKSIKLIAIILLTLTAFTFTSCENEPVDSAINLADFNRGEGAPRAVLRAGLRGR